MLGTRLGLTKLAQNLPDPVVDAVNANVDRRGNHRCGTGINICDW
jgi:hypothetical protein